MKPRNRPRNFGLGVVAIFSSTSASSTSWLPSIEMESTAERPAGIELHAPIHGKQRDSAAARRPRVRRATVGNDGMYAATRKQLEDQRTVEPWKWVRHSRAGTALAHGAFGAASALCLSCGSAFPSPPAPVAARIPEGTAVEVPYPPPPARVEFIPDEPRRGAVW